MINLTLAERRRFHTAKQIYKTVTLLPQSNL